VQVLKVKATVLAVAKAKAEAKVCLLAR